MLLAAVTLFAGGSAALVNSGTAKAGTWGLANEGWVYMEYSGRLKQSEWLHDTDGSWYYLNSQNVMLANTWEWIDGNNDGMAECYCFGPTGAAYISTTTPDGYTVDANGAWTVNGTLQQKAVPVTNTSTGATTNSSSTGSSTGSSGSSSSTGTSTGSSSDGGYTMKDYAYAYNIPTYYKIDEKWAYTPATKENIIEFINDYRANYEYTSKYWKETPTPFMLEENDELDALAETRAHEMAEQTGLTHTRPDGTSGTDSIKGKNGKILSISSEICGGWSEGDSVANQMSGFIKSVLHHTAVVGPKYKYAGVGIYNGYICINFAGENFGYVE